MSKVTSALEAVPALAADKLKRICVHVSQQHLADAKRLSKVLLSSEGKKLTTSAVLRLAQDKGLEFLLQGLNEGAH
ncbi:hypothetical protein [Scleromatobacter humisilvae]|uniref:Uncharacterized protein n=1 Tax=Scleromatobacter humisilvae TaxID=2897159 RepID=A0A9X2C0G2_9BURK|nr:hypothetical protein [Scleromatobacter humisilvae]MCK9687302.1 hypothetical protein [Scleromatobacter humisilvae]